MPTSPETNKKPPKGGGGGETRGHQGPLLCKSDACSLGGGERTPTVSRVCPSATETAGRGTVCLVWILGGSGVGGLVIRGTLQHQWRLGSSRVVAHGARQRPSPFLPPFLPDFCPHEFTPASLVRRGGWGGKRGFRVVCTHHAAPFSSPSFCGRGRWGNELGGSEEQRVAEVLPPRGRAGEGCENIRIEFART